ncbi:hypothetical protein QAD02_018625 [Eretmocerus hayati]|uniref:Uncharacterized protein n=2 Tax=Eretmocerus hayati TaxID=131215 RepID=A0ACC2PM31_9HYME|nr:hypothetical protein QAD02_018622 [Eretmocerus hayati]KAJ8682833.1 hypothetical protein QAD02_018625 [Eretmocerus hayati]
MSCRKPYPNLSPWQQKRRIKKLTENDLNVIASRTIASNQNSSFSNSNADRALPPVENERENLVENVNKASSSDNVRDEFPEINDNQAVDGGNGGNISAVEESNDLSEGELTNDENEASSDSENSQSDNADDFSAEERTDDDDDEREEGFDLECFLREWSLTNSITQCATTKLLHGLREAGHDDLPLDARTLLHTPSTPVETKAIGSGAYVHYGLRKALLEQFQCVDQRHIPREIPLTIHIDGVTISKSSKSELYTILGKIDECEHFTESFIIGAHHGEGKPSNVHDFVKDFLDELTDLNVNGFDYNGVQYTVYLNKISADTPAKNFILNFPPHNSRCGKCIQDGFNIGRRRIFLENDAPLRTNENWRTGLPAKYENLTSPFDGYVDPINDIPVDPMHHYYLGVGKKHTGLFVSSIKSVGNDALVEELNKDYVSLKQWTPMEFVRKPRKLTDYPHFKATEFRMIVLYTGTVIFSKYINDEKMLHFNLFSLAARYLSSEEYCVSKNSDAKDLLTVYVEQMEILYGAHNIIFNVHNLIHSPDDVLLHGTLDSYGAWLFENQLRFVRKNVRQGNHILAQIINRSNEQAVVTMSRSRAKNKEVFNGPKDFKISYKLKRVTLPEGYSNANKFIKFPKFTLTNSKPNNCCYLEDGSLVTIQLICEKSNTGEQVILFTEFTDLLPIENYPIDSREIGICKSDSPGEDLYECSVSFIKQKVFQMYFDGSFYFFPMLHCV